MPTSSTATAVTGKRFTFQHGTTDGSAQVTSASIDETANSETIQTLSSNVAISKGVESKLSAEFLYDGDAVAGGFYGALKSALTSGTAGNITITGQSDKWQGSAIVTSLSAEIPADGAVTCKAEFAISGALTFTAPTTLQTPAP